MKKEEVSETKPVNSASVIEVIKIEVVRGKGNGDDPMRSVTQYWSKNGEFLAENDPIKTDAMLGIEPVTFDLNRVTDSLGKHLQHLLEQIVEGSSSATGDSPEA